MKSLIVCKLIFVLWYRSFQKVINTRLKLITASVLLLLIVAFAAFAGYKLTSSILHDFLNGDERLLFLLSLALHMNSSIFVFGLYIFFKSITPEQNQFSMQLRWFPLKSYERNLGYYSPIIAVISLIVLCGDIIIVLPSFIAAQVGIVFPLLFFFILLLQIIFVNLLLNTAYNVIYFVISLMGILFKKFLTLFIVLICSFYYMFNAISINGLTKAYSGFDYNLAYLCSPLFTKAIAHTDYSDANVPMIIIIFIIAAASFFFSLFLPETVRDTTASRFLNFIPFPSNKVLAIIVKEIKTQCRNEENVLNFMVVTVIALFLRLKFNVGGAGSTILLFLSGTSGIVALNSYGNEHSYAPMYKTFSIKPLTVLLSKFLALIFLAIFNFVFLAKIVLSLPLFDWSSLVKYILILINSSMMFYVLGLIVPVGKKNPHMGVLALSSLIFVLLPITFILTYVLEGVSRTNLILMLCVFEILLCGVFWYVSNWRFKHV